MLKDKYDINKLSDFAELLKKDKDRKMIAVLMTVLRHAEEGKPMNFESAKKEVENLIETLLKLREEMLNTKQEKSNELK